MTYKLNINNRAFNAIKENTKKVEIRVTKDNLDYNDIKEKDLIEFTNDNNETLTCEVLANNHYNSIEELLTLEGTRYTLSSTNDYNEGIASINSLDGYKENIEKNGVNAIHIKPFEDKYIVVMTLCNSIDIMNKIINDLLVKKLVSGAQIYECFSKYFWQGNIEESKEYRIEFRTKLSRYKEIEKSIRAIHDYDTCEISYYVIDGHQDFLDWIDLETKAK